MDSPFHHAYIPAHAAHYLFSGSPSDREATIMKCLGIYHGIHHVSDNDIDEYKFKEWKKNNEELYQKIINLEIKPNEAIEDKDVLEYVKGCIYKEIGITQESKALSLLEQKICTKLNNNNYVIVSDQVRREFKIGDNITVIGKIDGMLSLDVDEKRTRKAVIEVKTRMNGFRDNPADLTQLTLYSRMVPNARTQMYILAEYDPYLKDIKHTTYTYAQVEEHWNNVVYPGLKGVYLDLCAVWKKYTDDSDPNYIGNSYKKNMIALIDKFLLILNVPDMNGDPGLIALLNTSKDLIENNLRASYTQFSGCVTAEVILRVQRRDLLFFEENLKTFLRLDPKKKGVVEGYIDKYTTYITGIVKDNITPKTRDSLWKLIDNLLSAL